MNTDRIEKKVVIHAPLERVWRAIADSSEFGYWFGATIEGPFQKGVAVPAKIAGTRVDPEVAAQQEPYVGTPFELTVVDMEPQRLLSFVWYPYGCWPSEDSPGYSTLVEFQLQEVEGGVELTIVESGFDRIPIDKRAKAMEMNSHGWQEQARLVRTYVEQKL